MKSEADKLDINKLVNFQSSFDNLKTKIWFGCWYVENCSVELKKLSDAVFNEVPKIWKFEKLSTK